MSKGKWGESFLKSGLPLERLARVTLSSAGWLCKAGVEISRPNREQQEEWFELDIDASWPSPNQDTHLTMLVECKYHDLSRFWFFLPHDRERWHFDDRVLNCGPFQTLADDHLHIMLDLAPCSMGGIVVSEDGTKQDNAVHTAVQQLANGFVPYCLNFCFSYCLDYREAGIDQINFQPAVSAVMPCIVTNASLYGLRPEINDLETIRAAGSPADIADEVQWTWLFYDPPMSLFRQNLKAVNRHMRREAEIVHRFPFVVDRMNGCCSRPNWIAVVNIRYLKDAATQVAETFFNLKTISVHDLLRGKYSAPGAG